MGVFQEKLAALRATGSSGGGMVEIDLNGKFEVTGVRIAKEAIEDGDAQMLQDLTMAAFNSGVEKIQETLKLEMGAMAGNFGIPGMAGL